MAKRLGHKDHNPVDRGGGKRIAMVISNAATSSTTGWPVGFWWSELAHPFHVFTEHDYEVEVFSPNGGKCVADAISDPRDPSGWSAGDLITTGFIFTPEYAGLVETTRSAAEIDVSSFDAIVIAGGQGPMFTFEDAAALREKFVEFYETGKIACALCHGVAILRYARLRTGEPLVKGKVVTGFSNLEEDAANEGTWAMGALPRDKPVMPWRIEDEMKRLGGVYTQGGLWRGFATRDGNLVTGQQNFSGSETAELVVRALGE
jgi:putative intracellular protease/amidase